MRAAYVKWKTVQYLACPNTRLQPLAYWRLPSNRPRDNDLWIAAQAIENGYVLLTLNANDFVDLPGLRLTTLLPKVSVGP